MDSEVDDNNNNEVLEENITEFPEPIGYSSNNQLFTGY